MKWRIWPLDEALEVVESSEQWLRLALLWWQQSLAATYYCDYGGEG